MSERSIVVYRIEPDNAHGLSDETKAYLDALTDEEVERAAADDPDASIFTEEELTRFPDGIDPLDVIRAERDFHDLLEKYPPEVLKLVGVIETKVNSDSST